MHKWFGFGFTLAGAFMIIALKFAIEPRQIRLINGVVASGIFGGILGIVSTWIDNTQPAYWCAARILTFAPIGAMAMAGAF